MKIDPNDPAMPADYYIDGNGIKDLQMGLNHFRGRGLSIRAEIAARNMAALLSDRSNFTALAPKIRWIDTDKEVETKIKKALVNAMGTFAKLSVEMADALIAELNKEQSH